MEEKTELLYDEESVYYFSGDYDGSLGSAYDVMDKGVIEGNTDLLNEIRKNSKKFSKTVLLSGSNRQSDYGDAKNCLRNKNGSSFSALWAIAANLGIDFDTFLMSDIFKDLKTPGLSYKEAKEKTEAFTQEQLEKLHTQQEGSAGWNFDESKITLLYAQMQKAARDNPNKKIVFEFCDDSEVILKKLQAFYSQNPEMIPANVQLKLSRYPSTGKKTPEQYGDIIQGKGCIDNNYPETINKMLGLVKPEQEGQWDLLKCSYGVIQPFTEEQKEQLAKIEKERVAFDKNSVGSDSTKSIIKPKALKSTQADVDFESYQKKTKQPDEAHQNIFRAYLLFKNSPRDPIDRANFSAVYEENKKSFDTEFSEILETLVSDKPPAPEAKLPNLNFIRFVPSSSSEGVFEFDAPSLNSIPLHLKEEQQALTLTVDHLIQYAHQKDVKVLEIKTKLDVGNKDVLYALAKKYMESGLTTEIRFSGGVTCAGKDCSTEWNDWFYNLKVQALRKQMGREAPTADFDFSLLVDNSKSESKSRGKPRRLKLALLQGKLGKLAQSGRSGKSSMEAHTVQEQSQEQQQEEEEEQQEQQQQQQQQNAERAQNFELFSESHKDKDSGENLNDRFKDTVNYSNLATMIPYAKKVWGVSHNEAGERLHQLWFNVTGDCSEDIDDARKKITDIDRATFELLIKHDREFTGGIVEHHLPHGFGLGLQTEPDKDKPGQVKVVKQILFYDKDRFNPGHNPLSITLKDRPQIDESKLSLRQFISVDQMHDYDNLEKKYQTAFQAVYKDAPSPEFFKNYFKLLTINQEKLGPQEETQFLDAIKLLGLDDPAYHDAFRDLLTRVPASSVFALVKELTEIKNLSIQRNDPYIYAGFKSYFLENNPDLTSLVLEDGLSSLAAFRMMVEKHPSRYLWWNELMKRHTEYNKFNVAGKPVNANKFNELFAAFDYFCEELGKKPIECKELPVVAGFAHVKNLKTDLDRLLYLIKNSPEPKEQFEKLDGLDLSNQGAYFAKFHEDFHTVTDEMQCLAQKEDAPVSIDKHRPPIYYLERKNKAWGNLEYVLTPGTSEEANVKQFKKKGNKNIARLIQVDRSNVALFDLLTRSATEQGLGEGNRYYGFSTVEVDCFYIQEELLQKYNKLSVQKDFDEKNFIDTYLNQGRDQKGLEPFSFTFFDHQENYCFSEPQASSIARSAAPDAFMEHRKLVSGVKLEKRPFTYVVTLRALAEGAKKNGAEINLLRYERDFYRYLGAAIPTQNYDIYKEMKSFISGHKDEHMLMYVIAMTTTSFRSLRQDTDCISLMQELGLKYFNDVDSLKFLKEMTSDSFLDLPVKPCLTDLSHMLSLYSAQTNTADKTQHFDIHCRLIKALGEDYLNALKLAANNPSVMNNPLNYLKACDELVKNNPDHPNIKSAIALSGLINYESGIDPNPLAILLNKLPKSDLSGPEGGLNYKAKLYKLLLKAQPNPNNPQAGLPSAQKLVDFVEYFYQNYPNQETGLRIFCQKAQKVFPSLNFPNEENLSTAMSAFMSLSDEEFQKLYSDFVSAITQNIGGNLLNEVDYASINAAQLAEEDLQKEMEERKKQVDPNLVKQFREEDEPEEVKNKEELAEGLEGEDAAEFKKILASKKEKKPEQEEDILSNLVEGDENKVVPGFVDTKYRQDLKTQWDENTTYNKSLSEKKKKLTEKKIELDEQKSACLEKIQDLANERKEIQKRQQELRQRKKDLATLEIEISAKKSGLGFSEKEVYEDDEKELIKKKKELEQDIKQFIEDRNKLWKGEDGIAIELKNLEKKLSEWTKENIDVTRKIDEEKLKGELQGLKNDKASLEQRKAQFNSGTHIVTLWRILENAKNELQALQNEYTQETFYKNWCENKNGGKGKEHYQNELSDKKKIYDESDTTFKQCNDRYLNHSSHTDISNAKSRLESLKEEMEAFTRYKNDQSMHIKELEEQVKKAQEEVEQATTFLSKITQNEPNMDILAPDIKKATAEFEKQKQDHEKQVARAEKTLQTKKDKLTELNKQLEKEKQYYDLCKTKEFASKNTDYDQELSKQITEESKKIEEAKAQLENYRKEIQYDALEITLKDAKRELDNAETNKVAYDRYEKDLANLGSAEEILRAQKQKLEHLTTKITTAEKNVNQAQVAYDNKSKESSDIDVETRKLQLRATFLQGHRTECKNAEEGSGLLQFFMKLASKKIASIREVIKQNQRAAEDSFLDTKPMDLEARFKLIDNLYQGVWKEISLLVAIARRIPVIKEGVKDAEQAIFKFFNEEILGGLSAAFALKIKEVNRIKNTDLQALTGAMEKERFVLERLNKETLIETKSLAFYSQTSNEFLTVLSEYGVRHNLRTGNQKQNADALYSFLNGYFQQEKTSLLGLLKPSRSEKMDYKTDRLKTMKMILEKLPSPNLISVDSLFPLDKRNKFFEAKEDEVKLIVEFLGLLKNHEKQLTGELAQKLTRCFYEQKNSNEKQTLIDTANKFLDYKFLPELKELSDMVLYRLDEQNFKNAFESLKSINEYLKEPNRAHLAPYLIKIIKASTNKNPDFVPVMNTLLHWLEKDKTADSGLMIKKALIIEAAFKYNTTIDNNLIDKVSALDDEKLLSQITVLLKTKGNKKEICTELYQKIQKGDTDLSDYVKTELERKPDEDFSNKKTFRLLKELIPEEMEFTAKDRSEIRKMLIKINEYGREFVDEKVNVLAKIKELQEQLNGTTIDPATRQDLQLQLIACLREARYGSDGIWMKTVQLLPLVLSIYSGNNQFCEIKTGEGKSLINGFQAAFLNLQGYRVDVVAHNIMQAEEDYNKNKLFFDSLGLKSNFIKSTTKFDENSFCNGINYSDIGNLSLYKQIAKAQNPSLWKKIKGSKVALLLDELDFHLFDNKISFNYAEPLGSKDIYSNPYSFVYPFINTFIDSDELFRDQTRLPDEDVRQLRNRFNESDAFTPEQKKLILNLSNEQLSLWIDAAILAKGYFEAKPRPFVTEKNISDEKRGKKEIHYARILQEDVITDSKWSNGGQWFLHARLNAELDKNDPDKKTPRYPYDAEMKIISSQNTAGFFDEYLSAEEGVVLASSGTLGTKGHIQEILGRFFGKKAFSFFRIPEDEPSKRVENKIQVAEGIKGQANHIKKLVNQSPPKQPIVIICDSLEKVAEMEQLLKKQFPDHKINSMATFDTDGKVEAANKDRIKEIQDQAGQSGQITIATRLFGRGTDIRTEHDKGIHVIQTFIGHDRMNAQVMGRAARNGLLGTYSTVIDLESECKKYNIKPPRFWTRKNIDKTYKEIVARIEEDSKVERAYMTQIDDIKAYYAKYFDKLGKNPSLSVADKEKIKLLKQDFITRFEQIYNEAEYDSDPDFKCPNVFIRRDENGKLIEKPAELEQMVEQIYKNTHELVNDLLLQQSEEMSSVIWEKDDGAYKKQIQQILSDNKTKNPIYILVNQMDSEWITKYCPDDLNQENVRLITYDELQEKGVSDQDKDNFLFIQAEYPKCTSAKLLTSMAEKGINAVGRMVSCIHSDEVSVKQQLLDEITTKAKSKKNANQVEASVTTNEGGVREFKKKVKEIYGLRDKQPSKVNEKGVVLGEKTKTKYFQEYTDGHVQDLEKRSKKDNKKLTSTYSTILNAMKGGLRDSTDVQTTLISLLKQYQKGDKFHFIASDRKELVNQLLSDIQKPNGKTVAELVDAAIAQIKEQDKNVKLHFFDRDPEKSRLLTILETWSPLLWDIEQEQLQSGNDTSMTQD